MYLTPGVGAPIPELVPGLIFSEVPGPVDQPLDSKWIGQLIRNRGSLPVYYYFYQTSTENGGSIALWLMH